MKNEINELKDELKEKDKKIESMKKSAFSYIENSFRENDNERYLKFKTEIEEIIKLNTEKLDQELIDSNSKEMSKIRSKEDKRFSDHSESEFDRVYSSFATVDNVLNETNQSYYS